MIVMVRLESRLTSNRDSLMEDDYNSHHREDSIVDYIQGRIVSLIAYCYKKRKRGERYNFQVYSFRDYFDPKQEFENIKEYIGDQE